MVEYKVECMEAGATSSRIQQLLNQQATHGWILSCVVEGYKWIFYREVPLPPPPDYEKWTADPCQKLRDYPNPHEEAIGQMVENDVDEESSQRAVLRRGLLTASEAASRLKQASQGGKITIGDHGEPEPVIPKTILVQPLGRSDDEIQEMVQRIYSTPDPQETFYQMWSRMIAVPAKYLWPDDPKKS
jgi:hypothetical protein